MLYFKRSLTQILFVAWCLDKCLYFEQIYFTIFSAEFDFNVPHQSRKIKNKILLQPSTKLREAWLGSWFAEDLQNTLPLQSYLHSHKGKILNPFPAKGFPLDE